jgi:hypothetical protein
MNGLTQGENKLYRDVVITKLDVPDVMKQRKRYTRK